MLRKLVMGSLCAIGVHMALAQTTTVSSGNWSDPTIWSTNPTLPGANTNVNVTNPLVLDQNITIGTGDYSFFQNVTDVSGGTNYTLTVNTAGGILDIQSGITTFGGAASFDNSVLIVRNGATLILGATTLGNGTTITVESGGTLIINGDLTNNNNGGGTFTISGLVQVNGNYNAPVGSVELAGGGDFFTTGTITTNGSSDVFGSTNNCTTGPCSGRNLCSFSNVITAAQTLCSGGTPAALSGNAVASPTYSWESSTTSSTSGFGLAAGTNTGQNYSPTSLTQTNWFRRKATSGGCTGTSVPIQVSVVPSAGGWRGTTSDWNLNTNWCNNTVPTSTTDVTISTGVTNMPQMTAASLCRDLIINSGATVTVNGSNTFSLFGNLTNNGTFTTNTSTVTLSGASQQTISGNPINFNDLTVNNTTSGSTQVTVNSFLTVQGTLTMTAGNVNLSGYNFTLGTNAGATGTLVYSNGWLVNGNFTRWVSTPSIPDGDIRGLFPMGASTDKRLMYVSFPSTNPTSMGTIRLGHTEATTTSTVSFADPAASATIVVRRQDSFWSVATGNGLAGGTYNLRAGGTGFGTVGALTDLRLTRSGDVVGTNGGTVAGSTVTDFLVVRTGLTLANLTNNFYIGSIDAPQTPLPVKLVSFTGECTDDGVLLKWSTSMEENFDHFELERSSNGTSFEYLESVKGRGGLAIKTDYATVDATANAGTNYYRLKSVDLDATFEYSHIISVSVDSNGERVVIYPNPVQEKQFTLLVPSQNSSGRLLLTDQLGNPVFQSEIAPGEQTVELSDKIEEGFYIARIITPGVAPTIIKLWIE